MTYSRTLRWTPRLLAAGGVLAAGLWALSALAGEPETKAEKIARAMSAAPPSVSRGAMVMDVDGTMLREGSNGWVCMPGIGPGDDHPMCNDALWMKAMEALGAKQDFEADRIGISYMLAGDARVNNADPYDTEPGPGEVWVQEGPHLMVLVPRAALAGLTDDPDSGGPYVMWKDTPYAHIMIPVAERPPSGD